MADATIEDYYVEDRTFAPAADFAAGALARDRSLYDEADADYESFWARQARELLSWDTDFHTVLDWDLPLRPVVHRRQAQRVVQLPRPPC